MGEKAIIISIILFNIILIAFISGIIIFIREYRIKKKAHATELATVDLLHKQELLKTQTEIQNETMKYIGREIHDNVGQQLTLSSLYLQQLIFEKKAPHISEKLNDINAIINQSLDDLRLLSKSLTNDSVANSSISELIENECKKLRDLKNINITFEDKLNIEVISNQVKSIILRITQEFIQNSIKHSKCQSIEIAISNAKNKIMFSLKDNGKGFDISNMNNEGSGINNMKKRTEMIYGSFQLESTIKNGTKLIIEIPL